VPKLLPQSAEPVRPNTLVDPRVFGAIGQWQKETPEHKPEPPASRSAAALSPVPLQAAPPAPVQPAEAPPPPSVAVPIVVEAAPVVAVPPAEPAPPVVAKPAEPAKPEPAKFEAKPRRAIHLPKLSGGVVAWKLATAFFALSSAVLAYALLDRPQGFDISLAPIGIVNSPAPIFLVETGKTKLRLTSLADIEVPKENDLQLWMVLPNSERAISLGVLPASGGIFTPPQQPTEGTRFVVSLEPHGGTVSGKITGKVLYGGQLADR
jgi:anti-sigma-K factor RskA